MMYLQVNIKQLDTPNVFRDRNAANEYGCDS